MRNVVSQYLTAQLSGSNWGLSYSCCQTVAGTGSIRRLTHAYMSGAWGANTQRLGAGGRGPGFLTFTCLSTWLLQHGSSLASQAPEANGERGHVS